MFKTANSFNLFVKVNLVSQILILVGNITMISIDYLTNSKNSLSETIITILYAVFYFGVMIAIIVYMSRYKSNIDSYFSLRNFMGVLSMVECIHFIVFLLAFIKFETVIALILLIMAFIHTFLSSFLYTYLQKKAYLLYPDQYENEENTDKKYQY